MYDEPAHVLVTLESDLITTTTKVEGYYGEKFTVRRNFVSHNKLPSCL